MKRTVCLILTLILCVSAAVAQNLPENIVRETYKKLETYNAAAQIYRNEQNRRPLQPEANLKFELSDFRSGSTGEILKLRYAELVTLPTGDIVSLTRGGYSLDGGPQKATFAAAWEKGQYASVFDPAWTVADVFHFEPARFYDIEKYVSYQVTVKLDGRIRTYRALALLHAPGNTRGPEFWDAIVNGLGSVWEEKRPPYTSEEEFSTSAVIGDITTDSTSTFLPLWLSLDITDHASGSHGGTAEYKADCTQLPGSLQRCAVGISNFVALETGTLDYITPFFSHIGSKDQKTENRTGALGSSVSCASATGVAFSTCLIGTSCASTANVSLSLLVASAAATITGGNLWRDVNAEHFTCNLATAGTNCTTPTFNGSCPIGTT